MGESWNLEPGQVFNDRTTGLMGCPLTVVALRLPDSNRRIDIFHDRSTIPKKTWKTFFETSSLYVEPEMGGNGWWPLAFLHHFWSLQLCWLKNPDLPGRCNQRLARPIPAPGLFVASMWFQVPKTRCKRKLRRLWASLTLDVWNCGVCGLRPSYGQKGLWFSKSMMDRDLSACSSWHRHRSCAFSLRHLSEGQGTKEQPEKLSVSARSWSQLPTPPELPRMGSARCCDSWYPCPSLTGRVKPPKEALQAKRATQVLSYEQPSSLCQRFKSHNRWAYRAVELWQLHKRAVEFWSVTVLV